jgi:endonuclease-3
MKPYLYGKSYDWDKKLEPVLAKYRGRKHPLDYRNLYQLLVMVLLSAQNRDDQINKMAPALFKAYPNMESLALSNFDELIPYISTIRNFGNKAKWLLEIAQIVKKDENIPLTMESLVALKGIGRKSANIIMCEVKIPAEGIIVDLHVIRVAIRIGLITETTVGFKAEKELMKVLPREIWSEIGMAISFLGREVCRPKPKCQECPINEICNYYNAVFKKKVI